MLETILNPNPLMMLGYLCLLGAGLAAAGVVWWNQSEIRQKWTAQESATRVRGAR